MPNFSIRSNQKELLDRDDIPFVDISRNMQELEFINKHLGGHRITVIGLKKLIATLPNRPQMLHICEIGCGGGDNLKVIEKWCRNQSLKVRFTGIDINKECIQHAKIHCPLEEVDWMVSDYREVQFSKAPDIIFTSLFCHHFSSEELVKQLKWMKDQSGLGFFINDLHRHPMAYHCIKLLTYFFSKSYLVKNDAPLSVLRGFSKTDWQKILEEAGSANSIISWQWAFRWLVIHPTSQSLYLRS